MAGARAPYGMPAAVRVQVGCLPYEHDMLHWGTLVLCASQHSASGCSHSHMLRQWDHTYCASGTTHIAPVGPHFTADMPRPDKGAMCRALQLRDSAAPDIVDFSAIYKLVYGGKPAGQCAGPGGGGGQ
jgi:hypothetical protein